MCGCVCACPRAVRFSPNQPEPPQPDVLNMQSASKNQFKKATTNILWSTLLSGSAALSIKPTNQPTNPPTNQPINQPASQLTNSIPRTVQTSPHVLHAFAYVQRMCISLIWCMCRVGLQKKDLSVFANPPVRADADASRLCLHHALGAAAYR